MLLLHAAHLGGVGKPVQARQKVAIVVVGHGSERDEIPEVRGLKPKLKPAPKKQSYIYCCDKHHCSHCITLNVCCDW